MEETKETQYIKLLNPCKSELLVPREYSWTEKKKKMKIGTEFSKHTKLKKYDALLV